jgi:hypothetical protein
MNSSYVADPSLLIRLCIRSFSLIVNRGSAGQFLAGVEAIKYGLEHRGASRAEGAGITAGYLKPIILVACEVIELHGGVPVGVH